LCQNTQSVLAITYLSPNDSYVLTGPYCRIPDGGERKNTKVLALYLVLILDRLKESLGQMSIVFEYISIMEVDLHDHVPDASLDFRRHGIDEFEQYADGNQVHPGLFVFDLKNGFRIDSLFAIKAFEIVFIVFFDEMEKKKNGPDALWAGGSLFDCRHRSKRGDNDQEFRLVVSITLHNEICAKLR
jgi:hypothetical protein